MPAKFLTNSLTKIIAGLITCVGAISLGQYGIKALLDFSSLKSEPKMLIVNIVAAAIALISYAVLYKYYEKRKISELSTNGLIRFFIAGTLLGMLLQSLTVLVIYLNGNLSLLAVNSFLNLVPATIIALATAVIEEVLFRGIIFRLTEEKLGSYIALAISGLIFGLSHLGNPNSTFILAVGLSIQAGLLLGIAYMFSRHLWFPIAIHFAWNFTQSGIFGATTSGVAMGKSLLVAEITGPEIITGGQFGPEGSIQATLFCLIAAIILFRLVLKRDLLIKPFWVKKKVQTDVV